MKRKKKIKLISKVLLGKPQVLFPLAMLFVLAIGFVGWSIRVSRVDNIYKSTLTTYLVKSTPSPTVHYLHEQTTGTNVLALNNGKVTFVLPDSWIILKGSNLCGGTSYVDVNCIEAAKITPGENLPTRYGDGTEYFYITAKVDNNIDNNQAKNLAEIKGIGNVKESSTPINGYDTFYRLEQYDGDGTTIREISYFFTKDNLAIYLSARTYEPGKRNGSWVGDFRKFEPDIIAVAKSIKIN